MSESSRREIWSWSIFDFANSSYGLLIQSFLFPVFYQQFLAGGGGQADLWWGASVGISVVLAALCAPMIGALADHSKNKKEALIFFTLLSIAGTASLYFSPKLSLLGTSALYILTNFFYTSSLVIYDAFLQDVSTHHTRGRVSGLGWGLGYAGGILIMALTYPLYGPGFGSDNLGWYLLTFPLCALFYLIFSIPAFAFLKSHRHLLREKKPLSHSLPEAIKSLIATIKQWRSHKNILLFLIAFYLLSDGLNTIFSFVAIYMSATLGLDVSKVAMVILLAQIVGIPATIMSGRLTDRIGAKPVLYGAIVGWILVIILLLGSPGFTMMLLIGVITGLVVGSSQAPARSLLAKLVPPEQSCQFFGFNGFASKVSAALGPVLFGAISWATNSQKWALASVLVFFISSILVLRLVHEPMPQSRETV